MKKTEDQAIPSAENEVTSEEVKQGIQEQEVKKKPELSEEAKKERLFLSGMLLQQTEDLVEEKKRRKKKIDEVIIELNSGKKFTLGELKALLKATPNPYEPRFPNSVPFYSEIFRLNGWTEINPNDYYKPSVVGAWTNEIIYSRISSEIVPALRAINPMYPGGFRAYKHFQFLTPAAKEKLILFRDQAIALMKTCETWYEFRQKLFKEYGVPYQIELFKKS